MLKIDLQKISNISNYLETLFKNKVIYWFQIHSWNGYEYEIGDQFLASNSLSEEFSNIYDLKEDFIEFRFLCGVEKSICTKNELNFFEQLDAHKNQSPLFFTIPYSSREENPKEDLHACTCDFEINIKSHKNHFEFDLLNYKNLDLNHIKKDIVDILKMEPVVNPQTDTGKTDPIILPDLHIKKSIQNTIDHMISGDCYLANITHTHKINPEKKFISAQSFIKIWFQLKSRYGIFYYDEKIGISCFSPERFLLRKNDILAAEPIKGTISIQETPEQESAKEIWNNKKEIYEHTMVVDLLRHDLNEICQPGSVSVFRPFYLKRTHSLLQMQSSILGKIEKEKAIGSCLSAALPAGSITGTPKKKVCEIISEQEQNQRGYYTGICGILEANGNFDSCILIRSLFMGNDGVYFGVGAGITTLSCPQKEIEEFYIKLHSFSSVLKEL
jgi:anthranilate/para-aminobenzoate synthase component I